MYQPKIVVLDEKANIYGVLDERGNAIGTGSREICEMLLQLARTPIAQPGRRVPLPNLITGHDNLRSAIKI
jgi:hypothetical protein